MSHSFSNIDDPDRDFLHDYPEEYLPSLEHITRRVSNLFLKALPETHWVPLVTSAEVVVRKVPELINSGRLVEFVITNGTPPYSRYNSTNEHKIDIRAERSNAKTTTQIGPHFDVRLPAPVTDEKLSGAVRAITGYITAVDSPDRKGLPFGTNSTRTGLRRSSS
jgi:hypothetical protein